jgi:ribosomal 50S subunit-associated protein YjgA (DUF615 family)
MLKRITIAFLLIIQLFHVNCNSRRDPNDIVIAQIGKEEILLEDFRKFYELDPNFGIDSSGYDALLDELNKLIDHRREEVESKIQISEMELRELFFQDNIKVHVRHLFSRDSILIQLWHNRLAEGISFEILARQAFKDSILASNGGDLGWMKLSDLDSDFASGIIHLKKNEISPPVKTKWGYHLIQLLDREDQILIKEAEFQQNRNKIEKKLRNQRNKKAANQYISQYMRELNPQPVRQTFEMLWNTVSGLEEEREELSRIVQFSNMLVKELQIDLARYLNAPLIRFRGGEVSLGEYLNAQNDIPIGNRPRFQTKRQLSNRIGIWIRDDLLLKEAYRQGLDNHSRVQMEERKHMEQQFYLYYLSKEIDKIEIPPDIINYFKTGKKEGSDKFHKFHTVEEWRWWRGERNLHRTLSDTSQEVNINIGILEQENLRVDWNNPIRMFAIPKPE